MIIWDQKQNCWAITSSKKQMICTQESILSAFHFLEEVTARKLCFEIYWQKYKWERLLLKFFKSPPFLPQCKYFNLMNHKLHMRLRCVKYHNVLKTSNICSLEHKRYPWESPLHSFITIIKKKRPVPTASASLQAAHSRPICFYN